MVRVLARTIGHLVRNIVKSGFMPHTHSSYQTSNNNSIGLSNERQLYYDGVMLKGMYILLRETRQTAEQVHMAPG